MKEREIALQEAQGYLRSAQFFPMSFDEVSRFMTGFRTLTEKPVKDTVRTDQTPLPF
jgi:hypothetical protein